MGTPVEKQNFSVPFFLLAALILGCTAWSFYDEFVTRRPWEGYQRQFFQYEAAKLEDDLAYQKRVLASEETQKQLKDLTDQLHLAEDEAAGISHPSHTPDPAIRKRHEEALKQRDEARIAESDAEIKLKFEKSNWDGKFYQYRHALHAASLSEGAEKETLAQERDEYLKELHQIDDTIKNLDADLTQKKAKMDAAEKAVAQFVGKREELQKKIGVLNEPVSTLQEKIAEEKKKSPEYTQYWITQLNTVDRCQDCHAAIDRCGFSKPFEAVEAVKREEKDEDVIKRFCLNPDQLKDYVAVYDALCDGADQPPDEKDATELMSTQEMSRFEETARLYCGKKTLVVRWIKKDDGFHLAPDAAKAMRAVYEPRTEPASPATKSAEPRPAIASFDLPIWAQTHPYRSELIGNNHPAEQFGCTHCHGGEGAQTKGIGRFGAKPNEFNHGWDDKAPDGTLYWENPLLDLVAFETHKDNYAGDGKYLTRQRQFVETSCAQCHTEDRNLKFAPTLMQGRKLLSEMACYGCHPIDNYNDYRKPGPRLTSIKEKTSAGFVVQWIKYPRALRPRTRMPNFWPDAVDAEGKPRSGTPELEQREHEATAIAAYLWSNSEEGTLPTAPKGDLTRGEALFESVGCRGCHVIEAPGQPGAGARHIEASAARDYAPNLSDVGSKVNERWLYAWLKNPTAYWSQTRMPNLRLSDQEAADLTAFLMTKTEGHTYAAPVEFDPKNSTALNGLAQEGKTLITKYGCFGCHDIKGFEEAQRIGADLSDFGRKKVDLLDFGDAIVNPRKQTWYNWLDLKLRHPRSYKYQVVDARMPQFDFTDEEVNALMVFLRSESQEEIPSEYLAGRDDRRKAINQGEKTIEQLGCRNCHPIDDHGGLVRDRYVKTDAQGNVTEDNTALAPPILTGEGFRTQPPWLYGFLRSPISLRPWLKIRMPTFPLGIAIQTVANSKPVPRDRATEIVQYFSASANKTYPFVWTHDPPPPSDYLAQAQKMFDSVGCLKCHYTGTIPADRPPDNLAPNLALAKQRLRPDWIEFWLKDPQVFMPGTKMPTFYGEGGYIPGFFNNDPATQMRALRDFLMNMPETQPVAEKPKKRTKVSMLP
jgi:cytochrome c2